MKIKLPKTLAEPLTIPWAWIVPRMGVSKHEINDALHDLVDCYERENLIPGTPDSPLGGILAMLRSTAELAGASDASATAFPMIECKKHVGYEYVVLLGLPNDKKLYHWNRKSWFPYSPS